MTTKTTANASLYVNALTKQVSLSYTFDAWELHGRTIVAYVEVYDSSNRLICSHKDVGDENQRITFTELDIASFYKHGEQLTGVTYDTDGTITFQYEDMDLSGVKFRVIAAENVVKADETTVYSAGSIVRDNISPARDGTLAGEDLQYGKYKLVEVETDGKHTVAEDTAFEVNAYSGKGLEVDLPVGFKWYVKELYVPAGYTLDNKEYEVSFTDADSEVVNIEKYVDGSDGDGKVADEQQPGSILITKTDTEGRKLAGATYKLEYTETENGPWSVVTPYASSDAGILKGKANGVNANGELTTGNNGKVEFTGLLADGTIYYRVTEVETPDGYSLLEEPIYIGTLPKMADGDLDINRYDLNGDGTADNADLALLERAISGTVTLASGKGDLNGDGRVNNSDHQLMTAFLSQHLAQDVDGGDTPFNLCLMPISVQAEVFSLISFP